MDGVEAKITLQPEKIQKPRASSMLTPSLESSILAKNREHRKDPSILTSSIDSSQSSGTVSEILMLKGKAAGAGSGAHRLGLSNKVRIVPLHARIKTPPPIFKLSAKPKRKDDHGDIDSEEEYEGLTEAQIAKKREEKRKAAWYSP